MPSTLSAPTFVVGIDVASEKHSFAVLTPDKTVLGKPRDFANTGPGFAFLHEHLQSLGVAPSQIHIGLEATGRYWENLHTYLKNQGYHILLLHPQQTAQFARRRGLRAKTDRLDAVTIAHVLLSGEARPAYIPDENITTYREFVRMRLNLRKEGARYLCEIRDLLEVLFPEFMQVFAEPERKTPIALLKQYPSAHAFATASATDILAIMHKAAPHHYTLAKAQELIALAQKSAASGLARDARTTSLHILLDQLETVQKHVRALDEQIAGLLAQDEAAQKLEGVPGFGPHLAAILRAELGDVSRFKTSDQVVAYVGLDLTVRQSGKWQGHTKISKRGSAHIRQMLYMAAMSTIATPTSPFRAYYGQLKGRGLSGRAALVAVMRKLVVVAYQILKTNTSYNPLKVQSRTMNTTEPRLAACVS